MPFLFLASWGRVSACVCVCVCVCKDLNVRERDWAYVMISPWLRLTAMSLIPWDRGFIPKLQTRASWHCLEPNTRQLLIWLAAVLITSPLFLLYQTASLGMVAGVVLVWFPAVNPLVELFSLLQVSSSCVVCLYPRATPFQCSFLAPVPTSPFALSVLLEISYSGPFLGKLWASSKVYALLWLLASLRINSTFHWASCLAFC